MSMNLKPLQLVFPVPQVAGSESEIHIIANICKSTSL